MKHGAVWLVVVSCLAWSGASTSAAAEPVRPGPRYPRAMWLDEARSRLYTANEESASVTALGLERGVALDELALAPGSRPRSIAGVRGEDGATLLAVGLAYHDEVALVDVREEPPRLRHRASVRVDRGPAAVALGPAGRRAWVACEGNGSVIEIDTVAGAARRRLAVVEGPRILDVRREGGRELLTVGGRDAVGRYDLVSGEPLFERRLAGGRAFNLGALVVGEGRVHVVHQVKPTDGSILPQTIVWGLVIVNRLTVVDPRDGSGAERMTSLDFRHLAAGDPTALALLGSAPEDGRRRALITSAGTNRLIISRIDERPLPSADGPLERIASLTDVDVGRRPVDLALSAGGERAWVLCALDDAVVEVDLDRLRVARCLPLGDPPEATPEHLGARVFYDSRRSRGGWYSCNSCHPDGGSRGHRFDTASDGVAPAKRAPDLRGTSVTGPWAWLGKFDRLEAQVAASLESTMAVDDPPDPPDVEHVVAFLTALDRPRPPVPDQRHRGDPDRGARLFGAAGCKRCHPPPGYTVAGLRDVGVRDGAGTARYNPPSLRGVRDRFRFLHDGRAASVEEVFRVHNAERKHGRAHELTAEELADLVSFLETL